MPGSGPRNEEPDTEPNRTEPKPNGVDSRSNEFRSKNKSEPGNPETPSQDREGEPPRGRKGGNGYSHLNRKGNHLKGSKPDGTASRGQSRTGPGSDPGTRDASIKATMASPSRIAPESVPGVLIAKSLEPNDPKTAGTRGPGDTLPRPGKGNHLRGKRGGQ